MKQEIFDFWDLQNCEKINLSIKRYQWNGIRKDRKQSKFNNRY